MAAAALVAEGIVHSDISIVRLHGEACFYCGTARRPLRAAGSVAVTLAWVVVTCGCDRQGGR